MALRRWGLAAIGLLALGLVALAVVWVVLGPRPSDPFVFRSDPGGFELRLPAGWERGDGDEKDDESPYTWFEARRPTRLGPSTAWLYVTRGGAIGADPLAYGRDLALEDIRNLWGDVDVDISEASIEGRAAVELRFRHPIIRSLGFLPASDAEEVRYVTVRGTHVYELGISAWRELPDDASHIASSFELFAPTGVRAERNDELGFALDLPGGWNEHRPADVDVPAAVWAANTPEDGMPEHWSVLWRWETPYAEAVRDSVENAERRGRLVDRTAMRFAGRPATRVDFTLPREDAPGEAHLRTWLIDGPDGHTWQLLIGSLAPDHASAADVAASFRFIRT